MKDDTVIKFGKHKGKKVANVPAHYLLWFYKENIVKFQNGQMCGQYKELMEYISDYGTDHLKKEI